jgi:hypothetical protein
MVPRASLLHGWAGWAVLAGGHRVLRSQPGPVNRPTAVPARSSEGRGAEGVVKEVVLLGGGLVQPVCRAGSSRVGWWWGAGVASSGGVGVGGRSGVLGSKSQASVGESSRAACPWRNEASRPGQPRGPPARRRGTRGAGMLSKKGRLNRVRRIRVIATAHPL